MVRSIQPACFLTSFLLLLSAGSALADSITTTNNERFIGKVIKETRRTVVFESTAVGRITIRRSAIKEIERSLPGETKVAAPEVKAASLAPAGPPLPFAPNDRYDWLQIKSGEWLKGQVKSLQDDKLEFESEEMDFQKFEWKNVRVLRSPHLNSVRFDNHIEAEGTVLVITNRVFVFGNTTTNDYPRVNLLAITPTGSREINKWSADLMLGLSFRSGNTREVDYDGRATLMRRTPGTRLTLDYLGSFGSVNDSTTENNQRATATFDMFISRRLFVRVPDIEYYRDPLQNIANRLTLGASVGYDIIHNARTEWNFTVGPAWQRNWYDSVEPGVANPVDGVASVISTRFDIELTKRLDLILEYRGQITRHQQGDNTHHAVATLEFEIHKRLNLDISFVWDRISNPETESNGQTPDADDVRLTVGVGIKL